jgi:hypothetical protein
MSCAVLFTLHAKTMMHEREILEDWILDTVKNPDSNEVKREDEKHYLKTIPEAGEKTLRVIVNPSCSPPRVVTMFFDRRVQP